MNIIGRLTFFQNLFPKSLEISKEFEKVWKKVWKNFSKVLYYYFNAIINSIIFPERVEIHKTRLVAGTFTQNQANELSFSKKTKSHSLFPKQKSKLFSKVEIA